MALLYPRLAPQDAIARWEMLKDSNVQEMFRKRANSHPSQYYAAVGGQRVDSKALDNLAKDVRVIAQKYGYPEARADSSGFDADMTAYLGEKLDMPDGEALRPQTWAFISLVMLPDIVKWRFQKFALSRCTGGRRDCFHRLWLRARVFDLGATAANRWILVKHLTEDCFVSIIERPTIGGNITLSQIIGLTWMDTASSIGRGRMEDINRGAIKRIRATATLINIDALNYSELKGIVRHCFEVEARRATAASET